MALKNYTAYDGDGNEYSFQGDEGLTHDEIADVVDRMQPTKKANKEPGFFSGTGTAIKTGFANTVNSADTFIQLLAESDTPFVNYLSSLDSKPGETRDQRLLRHLDELEQRRQDRNKWANPTNEDPGWGAKRVGNIVTAVPNIISGLVAGPTNTEYEWNKNGESVGKSTAAGLIGVAGNAAGMIPGLQGAGSIATGVLSNIAQTAAQKVILKELADKKTTKSQNDLSFGDLVDAGLMGAIPPLAQKGINKLISRNQEKGQSFVDQAKNIITQEEEPVIPTQESVQTSPGERAFSDIVDNQLTGWNEPIRNNAPNPDAVMPWIQEQLAKDRYAKAQQDINNREEQQRFETARQTSLDLNAANRARQENAPTGFQDYLNNNKQAFDEVASPIAKSMDELQNAMNKTTLDRNNEIQRQIEEAKQQKAQSVINERQKQLEFETAQKQSLDFNASERARQLAAKPAGFDAWVKAFREKNGIKEGTPSEPSTKNADIEAAWNKYQQENGFSQEKTTQAEQQYQNQIKNEDSLYGLQDTLSKEPSPNYGRGEKTKQFDFSRSPDGEPRINVPKNQRGGVDMDAIIKSIGEASDRVTEAFKGLGKFSPSGSSSNKQAGWIANHPGFAGKDVDAINPKPLPFEDVRDKLLSTPDTSKIYSSIASGATLTAEKYHNNLIRYVGDLAQWTEKKTDWAKNNIVLPLRKDLLKMPDVNRQDLHDLMQWMSDNNKRLSSDQLNQIQGLSTKNKEFIQKFYKAQDDVLAQYNARRAEQGLEPIKKEEAYSAALRQGDWAVTLHSIDENGMPAKPIWNSRFNTPWEARKAIAWLKSQKGLSLEGTNIDKIVPENVRDFGTARIPKDVLGSFQETMKALDSEHPAAVAIQKAISDAQEAKGFKTARVNERFMNKQGVRGFEGDMPWLSAKENANRFFEAQLKTLEDAHKWNATQYSVEQFGKLLGDKQLLDSQPNAMNYAKQYVEHSMGLTKNIAGDLERSINNLSVEARDLVARNVPGADKVIPTGSVQGLTRGLKSMTTMLQLGGSVKHMINTPISALYSVGLATREFGLGVLHPMAIAKTMMDVPGAIAQGLSHELTGHELKVPMTEIGQQAMHYIEDNAPIMRNLLDQHNELGSNTVARKGMNFLRGTISVPIATQYLMTYMGFVHQLNEHGGFEDPIMLFKRAEDLTEMASTNFRHSEQPIAQNALGSVGNMAMLYKAPTFNYFHQLHMFGRDAVNGKSPLPLIAMLGMTATLAGVKNLPLMDVADSGWDMIKDGVSKYLPKWYANTKLFQGLGPRNYIVNHAPEVVADGAVSKFIGADMGSTFTPNVAEKPSDLVAPMYQEMREQAPLLHMGADALQGNFGTIKQDAIQGLYNNATPLLKGIMETNFDEFKVGKPDAQGNQKFKQTSDLRTNRAAVSRSPDQVLYRKWGLKELGEAKRSEVDFKNNEEQQRQNKAWDSLMEEAYNSAVHGDKDEAKSNFQAAMNLRPDGNAAQAFIERKGMYNYLTPREIDEVKAGNMKHLQKVLRIQ
ncbi:MAG TPA: hypothetical protein VFM18_04815 [Methanosarcina sp.]|nr:hypothetical protein [Methanosarcina sp.]